MLQKPVTEPQIPASIARDSELTAAFNAHLAAGHPHSQYFRQTDGDARYYQRNVSFFTSAPFQPASIAGNSIAMSWNFVEPGQGIAEFCNYCGLGGGDAFNFFRISGNPVSAPTISHRVARIDVAGAYVQTSDRRLKTHFSPAPGLEVILKLKPLIYTHWTCDGFDTLNQALKVGKFFTRKIGLIAQDLQRELPEAVTIPQNNSEPWGIDYNCVLPVVIRAIQQQNQIIQRQEQILNELQKQIIELSSKSQV
jgi:hypothetical protein